MISQKLSKARAYEEETAVTTGRPAFHLAARVGWMNDPNGFSFYGGQYHLFYQYYPYARKWGPMHWAHAVSDDLLHWTHLPAALAPDADYDAEGCFSGSAVQLPDGRHLLMYTGVGKTADGEIVQTQCLAIGDGVNYEKHPANPVLSPGALPGGTDIHDFRDPKMWQKDDGSYRAVIAHRAADGSGQVLLFGSEDGLIWSPRKTLAQNNFRFGVMWECPDFFMLDGKAVLFVSPQDMEGVANAWHSGNGNVCIIGRYDEATEEFTQEHCQTVDDGVDFYAMQTLLAPDGRRIMVAWMQNWDTLEPLPGVNWIGQMSLPRELSLRDGRLYQQPVRELEALRRKTTAYRDVCVAAPMTLDGIHGRHADMEVTLRPGKGGVYGSFTITLAQDDAHGATLCFEPKKGLLTLDRGCSGTRRAYAHRRSATVGCGTGEIRLRIILDRYSIEVFACEGEKAITMTIPTHERADGISFEADVEAMMDVTLHELAH